MTIRSSILGTGPYVYWPLDTGDATELVHGWNGWLQGDVDQNVVGLAPGDTALHLSPGGSFQSIQLDLSGVIDLTMSLYLSVSPGWVSAAPSPLMWIGVTGAGGHGPAIGLQQASGGQQPEVTAYWYPQTSTPAIQNLPAVASYWHQVGFSFTASTGLYALYIDGVQKSTLTTTAGHSAMGNSDILQVAFNQQLVVAHLVVWTHVVLATDMANIGAYSSQWPYTHPAWQEQQTDTGGGGGLTSDQAAQLSDIHGWTADIPGLVDAANFISSTVNTILGDVQAIYTDTQNIVNSLFPQLADFLNTIMNGITATITTVTGNLSRTVGQMLTGHEGDTLTENDFGTTCDSTPATYELGGGSFFRAQFIVTSMPDWYVFTGPGDTYTEQSLGTIEFHRGGVLQKRIGLHTTTQNEAPLPGLADVPLIGEFSVTPGDYQIVVYPSPGVCINTKAYHLP